MTRQGGGVHLSLYTIEWLSLSRPLATDSRENSSSVAIATRWLVVGWGVVGWLVSAGGESEV